VRNGCGELEAFTGSDRPVQLATDPDSDAHIDEWLGAP
jgi:hypothetical protein